MPWGHCHHGHQQGSSPRGSDVVDTGPGSSADARHHLHAHGRLCTISYFRRGPEQMGEEEQTVLQGGISGWMDCSSSWTYCCVCLVTQSCPTLCDPMDCSPPGSCVHGVSPGKNTRLGCHAFLRRIFPTQGLNPGLPHCWWILYYLSHRGSPFWSRRWVWRHRALPCLFSSQWKIEPSACSSKWVYSSHCSGHWMDRNNHWVVLSYTFPAS